MSYSRVRVGDICAVNKSSYSQKEKWKYVNYLDTGNITNNRIDEIQYIDLITGKLPSRAKRKVNHNSIIISTVRPNQLHYGIIKSQPENFLVSTGFAVIDVLDDTLDADYLYYVLTQKEIVAHLHAIAEQSTSAYPAIKPSDIQDLEILIPDLKTQKKIASLLISIDNRISINTKINENLEQQAQALFKAWFVDFEPFSGVMPDYWSETTLGKIATISTKSINPLKQPELYLEHYSIPAYDEHHYPVFEYASEIKSNKYILTGNSVMISKLNPDTKRIWRPLCLSENPVCSTEFIVYEANNPQHKDYIYSLIDSQSFSDYLCAHTTGSTNSRQRATPKTTLDYTCVLPDDDIIAKFCGAVTPMYNQIAANIIENQRLAVLRDTLLPKLMSGEIDVSAVKI